MKTRRHLPALLAATAIALSAACGRNATENAADDAVPGAGSATPVGETAEYQWYSEGTPAGSHTVLRSGDGRVST
ncbi:MAG: hypothetical protein ACREQZ_01470, partial [Woeseiaceae bacterium]